MIFLPKQNPRRGRPGVSRPPASRRPVPRTRVRAAQIMIEMYSSTNGTLKASFTPASPPGTPRSGLTM